MNQETLNLLELVIMIIKNAAQVIQDLKDGKIDPAKVDLLKLREGLLLLPMLPEEPEKTKGEEPQ